MLISFIIPAYNSEKCIAQCITSIVTASVDNTIYEVIIINDGSVDTTLEICTELANKYPQIIVIDQVNVGTSCARNAGLGIARGEYIWFVDSDDCIETSILNKLMEYYQFLITNIRRFRKDEKRNFCGVVPFSGGLPCISAEDCRHQGAAD